MADNLQIASLLTTIFGATAADFEAFASMHVYVQWRAYLAVDTAGVDSNLSQAVADARSAYATAHASVVSATASGIAGHDLIDSPLFWDYLCKVYGDKTLVVVAFRLKEKLAALGLPQELSSLSVDAIVELLCHVVFVTPEKFAIAWVKYLMLPHQRVADADPGFDAYGQDAESWFEDVDVVGCSSCCRMWCTATADVTIDANAEPVVHPVLGMCPVYRADGLAPLQHLGAFHVVDVTAPAFRVGVFSFDCAEQTDARQTAMLLLAKYVDGSYEVYQDVSPLDIPEDRKTNVRQLLMVTVRTGLVDQSDSSWHIITPLTL